MTNPVSSQFPAQTRWGGAVVKTNDYSVAVTDTGLWLVFNKGTAVTLTLLAAIPDIRWIVGVVNMGAGALTIARNGLTINNVAADVTLKQHQSTIISTDATNYYLGRITNLDASDIATGQLALARGGTGVDLSASGGATKVLAQDGSQVISARNLIAADIPDVSATYQVKSEKDAASGYAGLDASVRLKDAEKSLTRDTRTTTSEAITDSDRGKVITFSNAGAIAATIAQAGAAGNFADGWYTYLENIGAGAVTLTPTTSTVDGAATLVLQTNQGVLLFSDGTNYKTFRGKPTLVAGDVPDVSATYQVRSEKDAASGYAGLDANTHIATTKLTSAVDARTTVTEAIVDSDRAKLVTFSNASPVAATIAQAGVGSLFIAGWFAVLQNLGAGTVTLTPATSTVNGAATLVLTTGAAVILFSDGTNYEAAGVLPNPTSTVKGGVFSFAAMAQQFLKSLGTDGNLVAAQPAFTDISGQIDSTQLPNVIPVANTPGVQQNAYLPKFVQSNNGSVSPGTSIAVTYSVGITAGNLLVVCATWNSSSVTCYPTDTKSNIWIPMYPKQVINGSQSAQIWYAFNAIVGTTVVTFNFSGSVTARGYIHEYSNIALTDPLEWRSGYPIQVQSAFNTTNSGSSVIVTLPGPLTAGNLVLVKISWNDATSTVSTVVDDGSNTYSSVRAASTVQASPQNLPSGSGRSVQMYYAKNITGTTVGSTGATVTVTMSGTVKGIQVSVEEYTCVDTTSPLDASGATATSNLTSVGTDNFNRAENPLSTNWATATGANAGLRTDAGSSTLVEASSTTSPNASIRTDGTYNSDQYAELQIVTLPTATPGIGPSVRAASAADTRYVLMFAGTFGGVVNYLLQKRLAGVVTSLIAATAIPATCNNGTLNANDLVQLEATGGATTTLTLRINGIFLGSIQDASSAITGGKPGIDVQTGAAVVNAQGDNFAGGNVTATVGTVDSTGALTAAYNQELLTAYLYGSGGVTTAGLAESPVNYVTPTNPNNATGSVAAGLSFTCALTGVGRENVIIVGASWNSKTAFLVVTDDVGNQWYQGSAQCVNNTSAESAQIWYCPNALPNPSGALTVTLTFSAAVTAQGVASEFTGLDPYTSLDMGAVAIGNNTTPSSGNTNTLTWTEELVYGYAFGTATLAAAAGFTSIAAGTTTTVAEYKTQTASTAAIAATFTSGSGQWIACAITFKLAFQKVSHYGVGCDQRSTAWQSLQKGENPNPTWFHRGQENPISQAAIFRAAGIGTSSAAPSTGPIMAMSPNELIFAFAWCGGGSGGVGSGFTARETAGGNVTEDKVLSGGGITAGTFTQSSGSFIAIGAGFRCFSNTTDAQLHPSSPWDIDPGTVVLRDDFNAGIAATSGSIGDLGWAFTDNSGPAVTPTFRRTLCGAGGLGSGYYVLTNITTLAAVRYLMLLGSVDALDDYHMPLLDYPGWKSVHVFGHVFPTNTPALTGVRAVLNRTCYVGWVSMALAASAPSMLRPNGMFFGARFDTDGPVNAGGTSPGINDATWKLEGKVGTSTGVATRSNTVGAVFDTGITPQLGELHRLEIFCPSAGLVLMRFSGGPIVPFSPRQIIVSGDASASWTTTSGINNIGCGTSNSSANQFGPGSKVTISGQVVTSVANAAVNGKFTVLVARNPKTLYVQSGQISDAQGGGSASGLQVVGYAGALPLFAWGNGSATDTVKYGFAIDFFAFVWNPPIANTGTARKGYARYWNPGYLAP
jgi:hypothetical protein